MMSADAPTVETGQIVRFLSGPYTRFGGQVLSRRGNLLRVKLDIAHKEMVTVAAAAVRRLRER